MVEIPAFSGVDSSYGIAHAGDLKGYLMLLKQVNSVGVNDLSELKEYLKILSENADDREALHSFRIKIHSMKSTVNIMGALKLYGLAATLEEEAIKERVNEIIQLSPFFIEGFEKLAVEIRDYFGEDDIDKKAVDTKQINEYLHLLETSIKVYDIKNADSVVEKLKAFEWNDAEKELIQKLQIAVANLNADEVISISNKLKD